MIITNLAEIERVAKLPRRVWSESDLQALAARMTGLLKTNSGSMSLHPHQAQALAEIQKMRGGYMTLPVGAGKTLISALSPVVLGAKHPVLFVRAADLAKTHKDFLELSKHWKVPNPYRILTYELLQQPTRRTMLFDHAFDVVVCDEVDAIKTKKDVMGPRARRMLEYLQAHPDTVLVGLSGTPMSKSIEDFWFPLKAALKKNSPLPLVKSDCEQWATALDVTNEDREPYPLFDLGDGTETGPDKERAAKSLKTRLTQTWGIVTSTTMSCDQPIAHYPIKDIIVPPDIERAIEMMDACGETLGEDILESQAESWAYCREILCGFFYLWDPAPPQAWRQARKAWKRFVREKLLSPANYADSPHLVEQDYLDHPLRLEWREIEPTFDADANRKVAWVDEYLLKEIERRVTDPTIIWVKNIEFGKGLSRQMKVPYYGGGKQASSRILEENGDRTIIASIAAHHRAKNLQMFTRNLVVNPPSNAATWEQLIGRTHRQGQKKPVDVSTFLHHSLLVDDMRTALRYAKNIELTIGQPQKLLYMKGDKI